MTTRTAPARPARLAAPPGPSGGPAAVPGAPAVVLVAHGSADPAAAATVARLAGVVAGRRPGLLVRPAYLDHAGPRPDRVLADLAAAPVVVVPLLLTAAYHATVDLPAVLERLGSRPPVTGVLGPVRGVVPGPLLAGLRERLAEVAPVSGRPDGVVLAAAGTRDRAARAAVSTVAGALGDALGVPVGVGYASAARPDVGEAVDALRADGATRVAMATYFLAPGRLYLAAAYRARVGGATAVAAPLGASVHLADLILDRVDATLRDRQSRNAPA